MSQRRAETTGDPGQARCRDVGARTYKAVWLITMLRALSAPKTALIASSGHSGQGRRAGIARSGAGAGRAARAAMCSSSIACAHVAMCRRGVVVVASSTIIP